MMVAIFHLSLHLLKEDMDRICDYNRDVLRQTQFVSMVNWAIAQTVRKPSLHPATSFDICYLEEVTREECQEEALTFIQNALRDLEPDLYWDYHWRSNKTVILFGYSNGAISRFNVRYQRTTCPDKSHQFTTLAQFSDYVKNGEDHV